MALFNVVIYKTIEALDERDALALVEMQLEAGECCGFDVCEAQELEDEEEV